MLLGDNVMILIPDVMQSSTELIMLMSFMYHVLTVRSSEPSHQNNVTKYVENARLIYMPVFFRKSPPFDVVIIPEVNYSIHQ